MLLDRRAAHSRLASGAVGSACGQRGCNPFLLARCGLLNCEVVLELLSRALEDPSDSVRMVSMGQSRCAADTCLRCCPTPGCAAAVAGWRDGGKKHC